MQGTDEAFSARFNICLPPKQFAIASWATHPRANEILPTPKPLSLYQFVGICLSRRRTKKRTNSKGATTVRGEGCIHCPRHAERFRELILEKFDARVDGYGLHPMVRTDCF